MNGLSPVPVPPPCFLRSFSRYSVTMDSYSESVSRALRLSCSFPLLGFRLSWCWLCSCDRGPPEVRVMGGSGDEVRAAGNGPLRHSPTDLVSAVREASMAETLLTRLGSEDPDEVEEIRSIE